MTQQKVHEQCQPESEGRRQGTNYGPEQRRVDHRFEGGPQQQSGYPDDRGQAGQYGTTAGIYGNSPTHSANNPHGSSEAGGPWRDSPYGSDPRYEASFAHGGYGGYGVGSDQQQGGNEYRGGQRQYGGGTQQGQREAGHGEQGGYPAGNYEQGWDKHRSPGYQGGGGLHQSNYESSHGGGYHPGRYQQQEPERSRWPGSDWQHRPGEHGRGDEHSEFDPHYRQWREQQLRQLDDDYRAWREEHYGRFSSEFDEWRKNRSQAAGKGHEGNSAEGKAATGGTTGSTSTTPGNSSPGTVSQGRQAGSGGSPVPGTGSNTPGKQ